MIEVHTVGHITYHLVVDNPGQARQMGLTDTQWAEILQKGFTQLIDYQEVMPPMNHAQTILHNLADPFKHPPFGRCVANHGPMGMLRRMKKAPHTEIFYTWILTPKGYTLRAVHKVGTDDLLESIRSVGKMLEEKSVDQSEAEAVLDLLYAEVQKRA